MKPSTDMDLILRRARELGEAGIRALPEDQQAVIHGLVAAAANDKTEAACKADALYWLQNHTMTNNPQAEKLGLSYQAPMPKKGYFRPLFRAFEAWPRLFIPKTRDMLTSLSVCGFSTHRAQWSREETIFQTANEDKAGELVSFCQNFYDNQPRWLRDRHPLKVSNTFEIAYEGGGRIKAIASGEDKIRMFHPTRYVQDESAFLPDAQQCYDAAHPVCQQIICISSAGPGWFGDQCTRVIGAS